MWAEIKDFPQYSVSIYGEVKNTHTNKTIKPNKTKKGYLSIKLYRNRKPHYKLVHRLVAETFIPNNEDKPTVDHIDGNKENNTYTNLRWATHYEQSCNRDRGVAFPFYAINLRTHERELFTSQRECAKKLNINQASISLCLSGKRDRAKGYTFKKVEDNNEQTKEAN